MTRLFRDAIFPCRRPCLRTLRRAESDRGCGAASAGRARRTGRPARSGRPGPHRGGRQQRRRPSSGQGDVAAGRDVLGGRLHRRRRPAAARRNGPGLRRDTRPVHAGHLPALLHPRPQPATPPGTPGVPGPPRGPHPAAARRRAVDVHRHRPHPPPGLRTGQARRRARAPEGAAHPAPDRGHPVHPARPAGDRCGPPAPRQGRRCPRRAKLRRPGPGHREGRGRNRNPDGAGGQQVLHRRRGRRMPARRCPLP